ncbi:MAG: phosphoglucosamine mutase [Christensenellales bacterium]
MLKYFGTDGIREIVHKSSLCETAFFAGSALARIACQNNPNPKVLIAKDTRLSGELIENACAAGLGSGGCSIIKAGILPTPAAAYLSGLYECDYCIVISASHNPPEYNGIKIFEGTGKKLNVYQELELEKLIDERNAKSRGNLGKILDYSATSEDYIKYALSLLRHPLKGLKIVLDCANGATAVTAPEIFKRAGAAVTAINTSIASDRINDACGATFPSALKDCVRKQHADFGFSFDGDGDRVIVSDSRGNIYGGDSVLYILASYYKSENRLSGGAAVGTIMTNMGVEVSLKDAGIGLYRADVGDKYVLEKMTEHGLNLGAEESGHVILRDYLSTGDGVFTALELLNVIQSRGKNIKELIDNCKIYPQTLINVAVQREARDKICADERLKDKIAEIEAQLGGRGRIVIRPSGTEPKIRVMAECSDPVLSRVTAEQIAEFLKNVI